MGAFDALMEPNFFIRLRETEDGEDALGRPTKTVERSEPIDGLLRQTGTVEGEAFVVNEFVATMPLGTDLREDDLLEARERVYTVEGSPAEAVVPRSRIGVLTARLKYVGPVTP